ncbi:MAG TPA: NAD(P)H-dependent oxidoreductase [Chthoniobacteraceae bacterium]|nr:NAD(P)H-dependent oxidoreductase [Chthoniobacteraceae bacterium]
MKILAFAGSTRTGSFNKKLVRIAADGAREAGAEVTLIDLRDFPMPLYDGDLEASSGLPEHAKRFKHLMIDHHGLLIATPEYNSSITGVLKNAIDWASREESDDEPPLVAFRGKTAALVSASPGGFGATRSLRHVRGILVHMGVYLMPESVSISAAYEAFDEQGALKDAAKQKAAAAIGAKLAEFTRKLAL